MSIAEITRQVTPILKEYGARYAGVFGSVARGEDTEESDLDLVVNIEKPIGIYKFMELKEKLGHAVGREVDLVSQSTINKHLRSYLEQDLITIYGKR